MSSHLVVPASPAAQVPAHLVDSTSRYVASGLRRAANAIRAYAGDWRRFTTWYQVNRPDASTPTGLRNRALAAGLCGGVPARRTRSPQPRAPGL